MVGQQNVSLAGRDMGQVTVSANYFTSAAAITHGSCVSNLFKHLSSKFQLLGFSRQTLHYLRLIIFSHPFYPPCLLCIGSLVLLLKFSQLILYFVLVYIYTCISQFYNYTCTCILSVRLNKLTFTNSVHNDC